MGSLKDTPLAQVSEFYNGTDSEVAAATTASANTSGISSIGTKTSVNDQVQPTAGPSSTSTNQPSTAMIFEAATTTSNQDDDIILLDSLEGPLPFFMEPIVYIPKHPSLWPKIPQKPAMIARRKATIRKMQQEYRPLLRPPTIINLNNTLINANIAHSSQQPTSSARCQPSVGQPNLPLSINRCRPILLADASQQPPNSADNLRQNPHIWPSSTYQSRLGGVPNFTTFGSGVPSQTPLDWRNQYANHNHVINHNGNRVPAPAHTRGLIITNPNSQPANRQSIQFQPAQPHAVGNSLSPSYELLTQMLSQQQQNTSQKANRQNLPKFVPQAKPVRSAYEDFLSQVQLNLPNVDTNELYRQITSNQSQQIQIPVPSGADPAHWQRLMQNQLESAMLHGFNNQADSTQNNLCDVLGDMINMYGTLNSKGQQKPKAPPKPPTEDDMAKQDREVEANHDEEYQDIETYADYIPSKLKIGQPHPDPVVETSSLATVEPPDISYKLKLPSKVIDNGLLSALQLESVIYASQQHETFAHNSETRRGFLIGDGAGVGKGRTIAGIIYENYMRGRKKAIWFSVSPDLKLDAERDLRDLGSKIPVYALNKFDYGRRINFDSGVIFSTYSSLLGKSSRGGALSTRIGQLISWAGVDFEGVIVFDECHKAKNISLNQKKAAQSKTATYVLDLQERLPKARVVYASATGASETKHLGYMTRLGLWGDGTPYPTFVEFCETIEKRGVGAMELVAVDLKMRGSYIARQLSFKTTQFAIRVASLDDSFVTLYDECVDMWAKALKNFREAEEYFGDVKIIRTMWSSFWGAHQKFFKYLCIGSKVPLVVQIAKEALEDGKCVVIGLQSTGESKTNEALEEGDISEFISTARATFESLVENHFPAPKNTGRRAKRKTAESESIIPSGSACPATSSDDDSWPQLNGFSPKNELEDHNYTDTSSRFAKNKRILQELADEKRKQQKAKSSRTMRAKRRASKRPGYKSRIKFLADIDEDANDDDDEDFDTSSDTDVESDSRSSSKSDQTVIILSSSEDESSESFLQRNKVHNSMSEDDSDCFLIESGHTSSDLDPMVKYGKRLIELKDELLDLVDKVGSKLPNNTLDDLIDRLGGPSQVAEMTGRKGRIIKNEETGLISYKCRNETDALDRLNIAEKERFMSGQKSIAIISEAASSGISLQADRRVENQLRRVHITIELPWSADRAIQQFGRTHRSNQVSGPEYVFVISELAGEKRFASIVAKRLESLGALTHGDRRANTETRDLSQFNIVGRYCKQALEHLCQRVESGARFANIDPDYEGNFFIDAREAFIGSGLARSTRSRLFVPEPQALKITHFLNRLLGMRVRIQNAIFNLFIDYMERLIERNKVVGKYDAGILELNSESGKTHCSPPEDFYLKTKTGIVKCTLRDVQVERGISWSEAVTLLESDEMRDSRSGFYVSVNPLSKANMIFLLVREPKLVDSFRCYRPNTGRQAKPDYFDSLVRAGKKIDFDKAQAIWSKTFDATKTQCIHVCYFKSCKRIEAKMRCEVGLRHRSFCIMSGGILTAWPYLERKAPEVAQKLQIVRLKLDAGNRVIGPVIPQHCLAQARKALRDGESGVEF